MEESPTRGVGGASKAQSLPFDLKLNLPRYRYKKDVPASLSYKAAALLFLVVFGGVFGALWLDRRVRDNEPTVAQGGTRAPITSAGFGPDGGPFDFTDAAQRVIPSVVSIDTAVRAESLFGEKGLMVKGSQGSGVVVQSDGYIVTNAHVVRNPRQRSRVVPVDVVTVRTSDGKGYDARVVGIDELSDLAVIKVEAQNLVPATFGDSESIQIGDWVLAVGNQLGFDNSVSVGVVSSKNRWLETQEASLLIDAIQTDAAINRGNSGGALCNVMGEVVGINSSIATLDGVASGVGFAIPSKHVKRVVNDLIDHGIVRYAILGVEPFPATFSLSTPTDRGLLANWADSTEPPNYGVAVAMVNPTTPAGKAGVREYDVILEIEGRRLYSNVDLHRATMEKRPGDKVEIKLWSRGQTKTINVQLTSRSR